jgi:hypothetical protein
MLTGMQHETLMHLIEQDAIMPPRADQSIFESLVQKGFATKASPDGFTEIIEYYPTDAGKQALKDDDREPCPGGCGVWAEPYAPCCSYQCMAPTIPEDY